MVRFTIRELALATAFIAIACAALAYPHVVWQAALSLVALLALMAAIVAAIVARGRAQAIGIGFLACFLIYWLLWKFLLAGPFPPTAILDWLAPPLATSSDLAKVFAFTNTGHAVFSIALGYLGGRFAGWIYERRERT